MSAEHIDPEERERALRGRRVYERLLRVFPRGFRGVALLLAGGMAILRGLGYLPAFSMSPDQIPTGLESLTLVFPMEVWAGIWIMAGVQAIIRSFSRADEVAWGTIVGLMVVWGLGYSYGAVVSLIEGVPSREWLGTLSYLFVAAIFVLLLQHTKKVGDG